jgi:hypothetical protein
MGLDFCRDGMSSPTFDIAVKYTFIKSIIYLIKIIIKVFHLKIEILFFLKNINSKNF